MGRTQPDHGIGIDLRKAREKTATGSLTMAGDLARWLEDKGIEHVRGAPYHPQTQGKIERWHQTLKNRILLDNYYLPRDLERQVSAFVEHYNHVRYHESLSNLPRPTSISAESTQS